MSVEGSNIQMNDQPLWRFISLADWQYKHFKDTIAHFLGDVHNLIAVQHSGIVPLILSQKNGSTYLIAFAPSTFEELAKIDSSFLLFNSDSVHAMISDSLFEMYEVVMGNKATYKLHIRKHSKSIQQNQSLDN